MFFPLLTNLLLSVQTGQIPEPNFVFNADGSTFDRTSVGFQFSPAHNRLSYSLTDVRNFLSQEQGVTISKLCDVFELKLAGNDANFQDEDLPILMKLAQLPLPNLANIDVSGQKKAVYFLRELAKNRTLRNLRYINAEGSDIDLETLEQFQSLETYLPLVRDLPRRSEKYNTPVAPIFIKVGNTKLTAETDEQNQYRFAILDRPIGTTLPVLYISNAGNSEETEATIQILTQL